jgi:hypothetical protein
LFYLFNFCWFLSMFIDFYRFSLIFIDFRWFLSIFVDFHWFLSIFNQLLSIFNQLLSIFINFYRFLSIFIDILQLFRKFLTFSNFFGIDFLKVFGPKIGPKNGPKSGPEGSPGRGGVHKSRFFDPRENCKFWGPCWFGNKHPKIAFLHLPTDKPPVGTGWHVGTAKIGSFFDPKFKWKLNEKNLRFWGRTRCAQFWPRIGSESGAQKHPLFATVFCAKNDTFYRPNIFVFSGLKTQLFAYFFEFFQFFSTFFNFFQFFFNFFQLFSIFFEFFRYFFEFYRFWSIFSNFIEISRNF